MTHCTKRLELFGFLLTKKHFKVKKLEMQRRQRGKYQDSGSSFQSHCESGTSFQLKGKLCLKEF